MISFEKQTEKNLTLGHITFYFILILFLKKTFYYLLWGETDSSNYVNLCLFFIRPQFQAQFCLVCNIYDDSNHQDPRQNGWWNFQERISWMEMTVWWQEFFNGNMPFFPKTGPLWSHCQSFLGPEMCVSS